MNKTELITYLRKPDKLTKDQLVKLEEIVEANPYFLSARLLLAKASKEHNHPDTKKRVASAAIYSTDRALLKKYLSGNLFFLSQPPQAEEEAVTKTKSQSVEKTPVTSKHEKQSATAKSSKRDNQEVSKPSVAEEKPQKSISKKTADQQKPAQDQKESLKTPSKVPEPSSGGLDSILDELNRDMEDLKNSREKFAKVQQNIEEDDAVSAALQKASSNKVSKTEDLVSKEAPPNEEVDIKEELPTSPTEDPKEDKAKTELSKSNETSKPVTEEKEASNEEIEKSAEEITKQVLEAAKRAKEEVDKEDKIEEETRKKSVSKKEKDERVSDERAEKVIREPRFSRFSTRSYLSSEKKSEPSKPEEKKQEDTSEKKVEKKEEVVDQAETKSKEDEGNKIVLPDLSKAKPVARKNPRKRKSPLKDAIDSDTDKDTKKEEPKKKTTSKTKKAKKSEDEKKTVKKKTVKKAKTADTKTSTKAKASTKKKESAKKTSKEKTTKKDAKKSTKTKDDDKSDQRELIDKFIEESPTIKYQRNEGIKPEDLAERSSEWDPNLASEYLAEIYLHQGNKKRAIEIYEALSLKYPEKKSYFADLISKID